MDYAACNIVYVDRRALEDKLVRREDVVSNVSTLENSAPTTDGATTPRAINPVDSNVNILLTSFTEGRCNLIETAGSIGLGVERQLKMELTKYSSRVYLGQVLHVESFRPKSRIDRGFNTYPRFNRDSAR